MAGRGAKSVRNVTSAVDSYDSLSVKVEIFGTNYHGFDEKWRAESHQKTQKTPVVVLNGLRLRTLEKRVEESDPI